MVFKVQIFTMKLGSNQTCLAVIMINSVFKKDGNYYPQVFFKKCKYNEKKVIKYIIDDLEIYFDGSDEEQIKNKYRKV